MRLFTNCRTAIAAVLLAVTTTSAQDDPLASVLERAGQYLARYEREVTGIVCEEDYFQLARNVQTSSRRERRLRSDLLVIADEESGSVNFRDVYEVDGRAIHDRDERLARLFLRPGTDARDRAAAITEESARFNISVPEYRFTRTINYPYIALRFLRAENRARSRFRAESREVIGGVTTAVVSFQERGRPRLIASPDNASSRGRFWIEPESGAVVATEMQLDVTSPRPGMEAAVKVLYLEDPKVKLRVPATMDETYRIGAYATVEGRARYSNFRKFDVAVTTDIK